jgi:uncharacterized membrane protein
MGETPVTDMEVTANDRTWAALSWIPATPLWPLLAILSLVMEDTKDRPFVRQHAMLSLATGALLIPVTCVTLGLGGLLYLVFFYYAYQAYQGEAVTIPVVSDFVAERGWV